MIVFIKWLDPGESASVRVPRDDSTSVQGVESWDRIPDLQECISKMSLQWSRWSWISNYIISLNGTKPFFGIFNPIDGGFTCFDRGFAVYPYDFDCPEPSNITSSGVVPYKKMNIINPRDCVRWFSRLTVNLKGSLGVPQKKTFRVDGKESAMCFMIGGHYSDIFEKKCPLEEMKKARIAPLNFYFAKKTSWGEMKKYFISPSWDQYKNLIEQNHPSVREDDYYDYSHEDDGSGYARFDVTDA
jgi:hypothetical protein